jgi:8-oxo-dGTP pyrophosphatase MutT (NUDIX family)
MKELLAPNGNPSNLTSEQYQLVRTPSFKQWFGDWENDTENSSKVVDENGEPKEVARMDDIRKYNYGEEYPIFFCEKEDVKYFTEFGTNETFVFLNIRNPLIIPFGQVWDNIPYEELIKVFSENDLVNMINYEWSENYKNFDEYYITIEGSEPFLFSTDIISNYVQSKKINDGIIIYNIDETAGGLVNTNDYIVFKSNQIKLADGTNTTFDAGNPDIRFKKGGLIAPNGKPSGLYFTEIYNLVRTKEFKNWFGDWEEAYKTKDYEGVSKIIDENGEPLICVHNTPKEFYEFDEYEIGRTTDAGYYGKGFYFTPNVGQSNYGEIELNCFLNLKNPYFKQSSYRNYELNSDELKNQGYDGVVVYPNWIENMSFENGVNGCEEVVVYYPEQIKLGDGRNTTFDNYNPDIRFNKGGEVIINPTEIECHKCHWHWKVKDGGDDLFICHKCYYDNSKYYKFEGLEGQKILNTISYSQGGESLSKTPAPKKERIYGSDKNKPESSKDTKSAEKIEFNEKTLETIKNKVAEHNEKNPSKKVTLASAKAVVRRGMGAYSSTHRPTISGGKPNSRVAWGLARLNAFFYKIINGKSKSGKYSQDNDLIEELGYKVQKYSDGGDIQAYEDALNITFNDGGETKPKKVYVSIQFDSNIEKIPNTFNEYFTTYAEKTFEELKNRKLQGVIGVSSSPNNIAEWFILRDCLIVMNYDEFMAINDTEIINYSDPYQLMKNNLFLFKRLYANISRYGEQENVYRQTLVKILEKVILEINLELNISEGQKAQELYRIARFLSPYNTRAFPEWIEKNSIKIESPIDLTIAILDFNKIDDSWLGVGFENPVLTFDELLPVIEKGVTNASKIYESEQEIFLTNRELNIPEESQLFFIGKDELNQIRQSNQRDLIEKYNLKELYKIYFVDRVELEKYRSLWYKKQDKIFQNNLEKGKEALELKKDQVLEEIFEYYLNKSLNSIKSEVEKYILDYSESLEFYDETIDDSVELNWYSIPIIESMFNTYILIVTNFWKSFIQKKQVKNLDIYAFSRFQDEVRNQLKTYFSSTDELDKLYNYRNTRGSGSLDAYLFERLFLKSVDDYENLPEWIDYKELAQIYLDKMGRELYRYYSKEDIQLISKYDEGGQTDEPNEFWGKEAGGVLVYCSNTDRFLILLRSEYVLEPNTWGIISGKLDDGEESIEQAVQRESQEEIGQTLPNLIPSFIYEKENFKFYNFVCIVNQEFEPKLNWENSEYKWVKLNEMPENLHFGLKLLLQKEDIENLIEKNKNMNQSSNPKDTITMDIPLLIRFSELMREDVKSDVQLHRVIDNMLDIKDKGVLTMDDYDSIIGTDVKVEEETMELGGKVNTIKSKKGDIQISLDENWYSDDSSVELVPVSELIKFREFDRKVSPKYNQDNSRDNIQHLKYMFQKQGVKSPLIIEYSPEDNSVLLIEGNHRLNSAIDLGMEYLPARVVLRKYGKFSPSKLANTMKVVGIKPNQSNYIPSDLKPSHIGIAGTKPLAYAEGGIIEGRLHSECGEDGCGRKFQVGENGHIIEAERDEAVIVADAFNDNQEYTIEGTPSEVASALNVMGGGKSFDKGATIIKNGQELEIPLLKTEAQDTDVDDVIDSGSIIINRRSMADDKEYKVTGTPKQIASAINSLNGNGVVIENGAEIKEN